MTTRANSLMELFGHFQVPTDRRDEDWVEKFEYQSTRFPEQIVARTVQQYIDGQVEGQSGKWLPEPTEFGMACDKNMDHIRFIERRKRIDRESFNALPPPQQQSTEERKAAHKRIIGQAHQFFDQIEDERVGEAGGGEAFKGLTAEALGDPRPIEERLNLRDTQAAYYQERETRKAPGLEKPPANVGELLDNLGVKVEEESAQSPQGVAL